ncbi:Poly [ADP-ribose] polymerase [Fasciola gigantica]|uniref:Poly [ADP-ribose] polymerase n=1 Tax=Fasciola gigantica TaxID=46835 RepID=A0A504YE10_FASGI|nr:Poly [ADP-ribose] polymerase [Fasciola gigantica]
MKRPLKDTQSTSSVAKLPKIEDDSEDKKPDVKVLTCKGRAPVDSLCTSKIGVAHVYYEADGTVYDAMLNQTNLQHNNNKYYLLQLLEDDDSKNYSVWFRWGRVGKTGQNKLESYGSDLDAAKNSFAKKFYDKTLNEWGHLDCFEKVKGKYDLVHLDYGTEIQNQNAAPQPDALPPAFMESMLPKAVQLLIQLICDLKLMEESVIELKYDARRAPLGKLKKDQIKEGYKALNSIANCINLLTDLGSKTETTDGKSVGRRNKRPKLNASEKRKLENDLLMACNAFYTRVPHDFGKLPFIAEGVKNSHVLIAVALSSMRVPPLIRTMDEVKEKLDLLQALDDIEFAVRVLKQEHKTSENILDVHYRQLKCDIRPLDEKEPMYDILCRYLQTNHGATHNWYKLELLDVFEYSKHDVENLFEDHGNRMLLWHGSRLTNWVGILGRGLKVAPPEAPSTGYMFGRGIYFADSSSKSANYIYPTQRKNVGLIALCEVSLGTSRELAEACYTADKLPAGMHSVKGVGRMEPDSSTWYRTEDQLTIPIGKLISIPGRSPTSHVLQFNEYIVYNPHQVRLRYVMKVKFNFS